MTATHFPWNPISQVREAQRGQGLGAAVVPPLAVWSELPRGLHTGPTSCVLSPADLPPPEPLAVCDDAEPLCVLSHRQPVIAANWNDVCSPGGHTSESALPSDFVVFSWLRRGLGSQQRRCGVSHSHLCPGVLMPGDAQGVPRSVCAVQGTC